MITNNHIRNYAAGDTVRIPRTVTKIAAGRTVVKAWLTVKAAEGDADPGLLQLVIDSSLAAVGQITDAGTTQADGTVTATLYFVLQSSATAALGAGTTAVYDIQLKLDDGSIGTTEKGDILFEKGITDATV